MNKTDRTRRIQPNNPVWHLLAEYSFSEFLPDQGEQDLIAARGLPPALREIGIPVEFIENIEMTLRSYAQEALAQFQHGFLDLPERMCIFCQNELIETASFAARSRQCRDDHPAEQGSISPRSIGDMQGGWGYFLVERRRNYPTSYPAIPGITVDLYLYKEGK